ncbi:hypothetical protein [Paenibacillus sp. FSL K6-2524]|uniref:hypothetical protein n=1 Tax=Paenibacillus sp. FSL K6-2524 TaxID=2954516 RepID=UPI004046EFB8
MVGGRVLISDSTHVKANTNKYKFTREQAQQNTRYYVDEQNAVVDVERQSQGKKALKPREEVNEDKEVKDCTTSQTADICIAKASRKVSFI